MKLKIFSYSLFFIFLLSIPVISFQQQDDNSIVDPWSFNDKFWKDLILVLIPIISGVITTIKLTDRWQIRKEKLDIKRKILDEFDNTVVRYAYRLTTFNRILTQQYTKIKEDTILNQYGRIDNLDINFPTNPDEYPSKVLSEHYLELAKDIGDIFNSMWKFESSLKFYYKDENFSKKCSNLIAKIRPAFFELQKMYFAENNTNFRQHHNDFGKLYEELQREFHSFRTELLGKEISEELFKKKHRFDSLKKKSTTNQSHK